MATQVCPWSQGCEDDVCFIRETGLYEDTLYQNAKKGGRHRLHIAYREISTLADIPYTQ